MTPKLNTKETQKPARKVTSGPIREKARTMNKLVASVGKVLKNKGYAGLNVASICKEAGVDRRLVYTYFGGLNNLIETYIVQKDYWVSSAKDIAVNLVENKEAPTSEDAAALLRGQFEAVYDDKVLQRLIHWELGEDNKILRKISDEREQLGEELFKLIEPSFENSEIDLRAVIALQVGGLYYLALHAQSNGSLFCGIDVLQPEGKQRIENALNKIMEMCYDEIQKRKNKNT